MLWTWPRLRSTVVALELPEDQYVVGLAGAMLANESVESADEVVLLATDQLREELTREDWPYSADKDGLTCPGEPGLVVRGGDVSDTYTAPIATLIADAWHQDGLRVVSVLRIERQAIESFLARSASDSEPTPESLTWTWPRLREAVTALGLPRPAYVVGLAGALLANESVSAVDGVELVVTAELRDDLVQRGWSVDADGVLLCPVEDDLSARSSDLDDTYVGDADELTGDAWLRDDVPLVSMVRVRAPAVEAVLRSSRNTGGRPDTTRT
ncbi:hypothetical protein FHP29_13000 [Nocardioides albidus]|uniref:Uncharacterized protein n=1 Tax=Nocardioides albidus TaxID=1517589 RepID=A0A5C4VV59_9ACTN|nr:hypothetical protein [Nocardioides albidus]TNM39770.1 hypothetical protein FHP29_13000 [Nocardioides albidus]